MHVSYMYVPASSQHNLNLSSEFEYVLHCALFLGNIDSGLNELTEKEGEIVLDRYLKVQFEKHASVK